MKRRKINLRNPKVCKCGHTHITEVGDLGDNGDEFGLDIILECTECDCESYEVLE